MGAFISIGKGSDEPMKFLEIEYCSSPSLQNNDPLVFVGKANPKPSYHSPLEMQEKQNMLLIPLI
eukprot:Awhi_evm1s13621